MGAVVLKHNWIRQPHGVARIDWRHPLTVNLRAFCVPFGNTFIDLVSGKLFTRQAHAVEYPYVNGQRFLGADTIGAGFRLDGIRLTDTVTQSVACFARLYNTSRSDTRKRAVRFFNAAANSTVVTIDYSGGTNSWAINGGVQVAGSVWPFVTLENDHIPGVRNVGFSRRANGGADFIGLPANLGSANWSAADFAYTIDAMTICGNEVNSFPFVGGAAFVGFYSEYTTFEKLDAITKNPWQILLSNTRLLWSGADLSLPLAADEITGVATTLGSPTLSQRHTVSAQEIVCDGVLSAPVLSQNHALGGVGESFGFSCAATADTPILGLVHELNANAVSGISVVLATPELDQVHALLINDVVVSPVLGVPSLSINAGPVALEASGIVSSALFDSPGLTQVHGLTTSAISSSTTAEHPGLGQTHALLTQGVIVQPSIAHPVLHSIQDLSAAGLSSTATVGQPAITVVSNIANPDGIVSATAVTHPAVSQIHNLTPLNIVVSPVNECPVLIQEHSLTALGVVSTVFLASPKVLAWVFLPKHYVELPSQGLTQLELAAIGRFDIERNSKGIMQVVVAADGTIAFEETTFGVLNKQKTSLGVLHLRLISTGEFSLTDIGG